MLQTPRTSLIVAIRVKQPYITIPLRVKMVLVTLSELVIRLKIILRIKKLSFLMLVMASANSLHGRPASKDKGLIYIVVYFPLAINLVKYYIIATHDDLNQACARASPAVALADGSNFSIRSINSPALAISSLVNSASRSLLK